MGIGGVVHTLNPRLADSDISYIADHGGDALILADLPFLPLLGRIWQNLPRMRGVVVLTDRHEGKWRRALSCARVHSCAVATAVTAPF
jgi:hypothetical protein